jgi:hypothetical protein
MLHDPKLQCLLLLQLEHLQAQQWGAVSVCDVLQPGLRWHAQLHTLTYPSLCTLVDTSRSSSPNPWYKPKQSPPPPCMIKGIAKGSSPPTPIKHPANPPPARVSAAVPAAPPPPPPAQHTAEASWQHHQHLMMLMGPTAAAAGASGLGCLVRPCGCDVLLGCPLHQDWGPRQTGQGCPGCQHHSRHQLLLLLLLLCCLSCCWMAAAAADAQVPLCVHLRPLTLPLLLLLAWCCWSCV